MIVRSGASGRGNPVRELQKNRTFAMKSAELSLEAGFYVTGGTLRGDAACYVERQADTELYDGLKQGKFCYVLTARQMGKSSLMVRTAARLREEGIGVAVLDLTGIGQNLSAEQWYGGLLTQVGQQLDLEDELEDFWQKEIRLGPLQRWLQAIRNVILRRHAANVVIFIDEIDSVRSLPFSTDEFFAGIREFYNRRSEDPEVERLTFCLLGVATPSDLIRDTRTTPFNIGQRIELNDFSEAEAAPLTKGMGREGKLAGALLQRVLYWTGGHPYLTQRLCQVVAEDQRVTNRSGVDRHCEDLFLSSRARERDDNLLFVRERMLRSEADLASLLELYRQIWGNKQVQDDDTNPLISILRLSGVTRIDAGYLYVRNRIYSGVFNGEWVTANMPDAELRRQRAAYRRGLLRATTIAAAFLMLMFGIQVYLVTSINRMHLKFRSLESLSFRATLLSVDLMRTRGLVEESTRKSLISSDPEYLSMSKEYERDFSSILERLQPLATSEKERKEIERLYGFWNQFQQDISRHRESNSKPEETPPVALMEHLDRVGAQTQTVYNATQETIESEIQKSAIMGAQAQWFALSGGALALALGCSMVLVIRRSIAELLHHRTKGAGA